MHLGKYVFPKAFPPCSDFWTNSARFGFKTDFLIKFLDGSAWFRLENSKNIFFQPKTLIFDQKSLTNPKQLKNNPQINKNTFGNKYVFLGGFPPGAEATHRSVICLVFFGMFRLLGECLNIF